MTNTETTTAQSAETIAHDLEPEHVLTFGGEITSIVYDNDAEIIVVECAAGTVTYDPFDMVTVTEASYSEVLAYRAAAAAGRIDAQRDLYA